MIPWPLVMSGIVFSCLCLCVRVCVNQECLSVTKSRTEGAAFTFLIQTDVCVWFSDVSKLQSHLNLLREEYMRLQTRHAELEKKYQVALAAAGKVGEDNFVSRLLKTVADLFGKELYRWAATHKAKWPWAMWASKWTAADTSNIVTLCTNCSGPSPWGSH